MSTDTTSPRYSSVDLMKAAVGDDESMQPNLFLWERLCNIHKDFTSPFERNGKSFTSISHVHGRALMTAIFGPQGTGWGYEISDWTERRGILSCMVTLWYKPGLVSSAYDSEQVAMVSEYGGTRLDNEDDDVCKKTVTDALSRCFMALGHGADIHAGLRDSKYNADKQANPTPTTPAKTESGPSSQQQPREQGQPEPSANAQATTTASVDEYVQTLIAKEPILGTCEYRTSDDCLYFLTPVNPDEKKYIHLGFKPSKNYKNRLFLDNPLPDHLRHVA